MAKRTLISTIDVSDDFSRVCGCICPHAAERGSLCRMFNRRRAPTGLGEFFRLDSCLELEEDELLPDADDADVDTNDDDVDGMRTEFADASSLFNPLVDDDWQ